MAARYWVGGTAAWDATAGTKWATTSGGAGGASVPTNADDVFFDAASGAVTVSISSVAGVGLSLNCTGFTGTFDFSAGFGLNISGSVTFSAGMTVSGTAWGLNINGAGTLTTNGKTLGAVVCQPGAGNTVTLGSALTCGSFQVSTGIFTTSPSNYALTATSITSSNTNTRTISLNGSTVTLSASTPLVFTTTTNLTFNRGTSTITLSNAAPTFNGSGLTYYNVTYSDTSSSVTTRAITGANTFNTLTLATPAADGIISYSFSANQTITTFVAAGASATRRIGLYSDTLGTARTITATTWTTVSDTDFRDITLTNAKSPTRGGDCGGNTNITFPAAKTVYWNLAGAQNWSATGWATSSGGTPAANNFPLAQDDAVFDNTGSVTGTITCNSAWNIKTINMSARTSAMTLQCAGLNGFTFYGNLTAGSGTTFSGTGYYDFYGRGSQTITSAGKTITQLLDIASIGGSVTLQDALTLSVISTHTLTSGTFDANGYNVTTGGGSFASSNTNTRTLALGSGTWTIGGSSWSTDTSTNLTLTGTGTISLTSASSKAFRSGSLTSYSGITLDQGGAGDLLVHGSSSYKNISNSYKATGATSISFIAGTTQTLTDFTASGQSGRVLTLQRSGASGVFTLAYTGTGLVGCDYLSISNSTATPLNTWYAGTHSTDGAGNTGWLFAADPSSSKFFMFF